MLIKLLSTFGTLLMVAWDVCAFSTVSMALNVQVFNDSAAESNAGGVLEYGWVATYDKTICRANDPSDCTQAAPIPIQPSGNGPIFTFTADSVANILSATLVYPITQDPDLPVGHAVVINVQNGENVIDRCQAEINPPMTGDIQYHAHVAQYGSEEDNSCRVQITRVDNAPQSSFVFMQNVPTYASHWESFTINNTAYLLSNISSPSGADNEMNVNNLFKFNSDTFQFDIADRIIPNECRQAFTGDWIRMDRVYSWRYFTINNQPAIVMANHNSVGKNFQFNCTEDAYWTKSYILWWDNDQFNDECLSDCMSILTDSPIMIEPYTVGGEHFLAVAEQGFAGISRSAIYRWNGNAFEKTDQPNLQLPHAYHIESFQDSDGFTYLVFSLGGYQEQIVIYQVDHKGQLHLYQGPSITSHAPIAPEGFVHTSFVFKQTDTNNKEHIYLLAGYSISGSNTANPWLYRWELDTATQRYLFKPYQSLSEPSFKHAGFYAPYSIDNQYYIAAAIGQEGAYGYRWNTSMAQLEMKHSHAIYEAKNGIYVQAITPFWVTDKEGSQHLLMAIAINGSGTDESPVVRWQAVKN
jgi:hypothetical protein